MRASRAAVLAVAATAAALATTVAAATPAAHRGAATTRRPAAGGAAGTAATAGTAAAGPAVATAVTGAPAISVVSTRADLVAGPEVLTSVSLPAGTDPGGVRVTLDGRDVTAEFALRPDGRYEGLLGGLSVGDDTVTATMPGGAVTTATIVDHPAGGPLFAGPQVLPWLCQNGSKDPTCAAPATFTYQYKSSVTGLLEPYDPSAPPKDVATTTTQNGTTVPFVVRTETGYQDRDQFQISVLFQPGRPWAAWAPQPQFVHKLLVTHGASCGADHQSSTAPSTTSDTAGVPGGPGAGSSPLTALGLGYAVMSTALDNAGHDCDLVTEAESLVMAKQHLVDHYGTLEFTIGTGCSGGSLVQQQVANAYPGVYQGILPQCSFPDAWSTGQQLADYQLTRDYFENPSSWGSGVVWTPVQIAAVQGHPDYANSVELSTLYWPTLADPAYACAGVSASQRWSPSNPTGVRCDLEDYMKNVFGPYQGSDPYGYAGIPLDNVGVEYGLSALQQGLITPAQFVDLNEKIGGFDDNFGRTAARFAAQEPALTYDYRSGAVNETNHLTDVAIIDLRGPDAGTFHDAYRSWAVRARLEQQEGGFPKNDVMWFGETPLIGDPRYTTEGLLAMDRWLSAVDGDHRQVPLARKIADDRPADVHDQCSDVPGVDQVALPGVGPVCELPLAQTRFGTPRTVAGEGIATDVEKCRLVPLRQSAFYPVAFTAAEWGVLEKAFPSGVCDFSAPGVDQAGAVAWLTYQRDPAGTSVVYGGTPLGPAPAGSGSGWADPVFSGWLDPPG